MSTQSPAAGVPSDSLAYAETLYVYAARRLDAFSLRCWIIQRLMLDEGLEHTCAETAFEHVLGTAGAAEAAKRVGQLRRQRRRESICAIGRSALRPNEPSPPSRRATD